MSIESEVDSDPTVRFFWGFAAAHFFLWLVVCFMTQPNMPLDMVEMLYWGQQWQLGYHKHPPLPAWIAASTWWLGGGQHLLMYCVSQLTVLTTFWAVWQLAREGLSPRAALCSVVLLEGCYYCTFMVNDINNTIITRPFWALAILFLYRALTRDSNTGRNLYWLLTGLVIGLGMISKYYMGVLVLTMLVIPVLIPATRARFKTMGPYLLTATAVLVFLPHLIWMFQNDFVTIEYALRRSDEKGGQNVALNHLIAPISFIGSQLGAFLPLLVLAWPMIRERKLRKNSAATDDGSHVGSEKEAETTAGQSFFHRYVTIVVLGPIVIYILVALVMGASIRSMWGGPLFSFFGVFLFSTFELPADRKVASKILRDSIIVGFCMLAALAIRSTVGPGVRDKLSRIHFPGVEAADELGRRWRSRFGSDLERIGGSMFVAASINAYMPGHVDVYAALSEEASPWLTDEEFNSQGGAIVWEMVEDRKWPPLGWMKRFPDAELLDPIELTSRAWSGPRDVKIGVMFVAPESVK